MKQAQEGAQSCVEHKSSPQCPLVLSCVYLVLVCVLDLSVRMRAISGNVVNAGKQSCPALSN